MNKEQFSQKEFESLLDKAKQDEDILGFFFGGSRGKGFEDEASDWDLRYVVRDGTKQNYSADIENTHFEPSEFEDMEFQVFEYSEFKGHALNGTKAWDRYSFAHVTALIDKTDDIQYLIDKKWRLSEDETQVLIPKHMDSYVHALYRSVYVKERNLYTYERWQDKYDWLVSIVD